MQRSWRIDWIRYEILPSSVYEAMQCNLVLVLVRVFCVYFTVCHLLAGELT